MEHALSSLQQHGHLCSFAEMCLPDAGCEELHFGEPEGLPGKGGRDEVRFIDIFIGHLSHSGEAPLLLMYQVLSAFKHGEEVSFRGLVEGGDGQVEPGFLPVGCPRGGTEGGAVAALVAEVGNVEDLVLLLYLKQAVFLKSYRVIFSQYGFLEVAAEWHHPVGSVGEVGTYRGAYAAYLITPQAASGLLYHCLPVLSLAYQGEGQPLVVGGFGGRLCRYTDSPFYHQLLF